MTGQECLARHDPLCDAMHAARSLATLPALQGFHDSAMEVVRIAQWRETYRDTPFGEPLHAHFGSFEVLGRDTPLSTATMRSFVIFQSPGFHYPMHHHPAEELYLVLAGEGDFHLEGAPSRSLGPGATAHHPPNAPHALTTQEQPIIAYVIWKGDIHEKPVWTCPEAR